jgi:hypothetical protein
VHEDGLGLIVGVVPYGNRLGASAHCYTAEEIVASAAGCLLYRQPVLGRQHGHIGVFDGARQTPIGSHATDKLGISVGIGATQAVVQMRHVEG